MKNKYIALGHCNVSLGIYLDSLFSIYEKDVSLEIISNLTPEENPFEGRPYLHEDIEIITTWYEEWQPSKQDQYLLTGMAPTTKKKTLDFYLTNFSLKEEQFVSLVHKSAIISHGVRFENPVFISSGSVVAQYSKIGKFVSIERNVIVGHHTTIGEFSSIFSGANIAAKCKIGNNVTICMGVIIFNGIEIDDNAVIGAGSLVTKSVPANTLVYGNSAKIVRKI